MEHLCKRNGCSTGVLARCAGADDGTFGGAVNGESPGNEPSHLERSADFALK